MICMIFINKCKNTQYGILHAWLISLKKRLKNRMYVLFLDASMAGDLESCRLRAKMNRSRETTHWAAGTDTLKFQLFSFHFPAWSEWWDIKLHPTAVKSPSQHGALHSVTRTVLMFCCSCCAFVWLCSVVLILVLSPPLSRHWFRPDCFHVFCA